MASSPPRGGWPPEIVKWMNGEPVSVAVVSSLGRMLTEFPDDLEVKHASKAAGRAYVDAAGSEADRAQRMDMAFTALRLEVSPGSTRQLTVAAFIAK